MSNYQDGKIYKLISNNIEYCYIGSTVQKLSDRFFKHENNFYKFIEGKFNFITSFILLEQEDCKIELIENFPCNSKEELYARERYWIENLNCVNKIVPTRTNKEYHEENKEYLSQKGKEYREENKEEIAQKKKAYQIKNKAKISEHYKNYRKENKEKLKEKNKQTIECECGMTVNKNHLVRHQKSKKHTDLLGLPPVIKDKKVIKKEHDKFKEYREKNKEKIKQKKKETVKCECGSIVNKNHLARHKRTQQHINSINV